MLNIVGWNLSLAYKGTPFLEKIVLPKIEVIPR